MEQLAYKLRAKVSRFTKDFVHDHTRYRFMLMANKRRCSESKGCDVDQVKRAGENTSFGHC